MRHQKQIILTAIVCDALMLLMLVALSISGYAYTDYQNELHAAAERCRNEFGCSDNCKVIKAFQKLWQQEERDIEILTTVIGNEAPWCTPEHQQYVGKVVVNRRNSKLFPDTIEEVVAQTSVLRGKEVYQYHPDYTNPDSARWKNVRKDPELYKACRAAAEAVLNGEVDCPSNVLWQANFPQGDGVWKKVEVDTGWYRSTTYFCYTEIDE